MKNSIYILISVVVLSACGGKNIKTTGKEMPGWVSGESTDYPADSYITAVGSADNINSAYDKARSQIAGVFSSDITVKSLVSEAETTQIYEGEEKSDSYTDIAEDIKTTAKKSLEGIEIPYWWYDNQSGKFYALAVLDRAKAAAILKQKISQISLKAKPLELEFEQIAKKTDSAKTALKLIGLYEKRKNLHSDLAIVLPTESYSYPRENQIRPKLVKAVSDIVAIVVVSGEYSDFLKPAIAKGLHSVGFSVKTTPGTGDILVSASFEFTTSFEPYHYSRWQWFNATVKTEIKDLETKTVFAGFTLSDRQASAQLATARKRAEKSLAEKVTEKIKLELENYFGK